MLRRSGREQLLGCVRVGERVARQTNLSIECRAKRRELRLSSASEGNRDGAKKLWACRSRATANSLERVTAREGCREMYR